MQILFAATICHREECGLNHVDHVLTFKSNNVLQTRFSRGFVASIYEIIGPVGWETVSKSKCKNVRSKAIFFYFGKGD